MSPAAEARRRAGRPAAGARPVAARDLEIGQVRALAALLGERSVSRAARALGQSQPQMSVTLRRLRAVLGDPILVRGGRGMVPTDRALALLEPARRIVEDIGRLRVEPAAFDPHALRRSLCLAIPDYIGAAILGAILGAIRAAAPSASVLVTPVRSESDGLDLLETGAADVLIESCLIRTATLRHRALFDDVVASVARRGHPQVRPGLSLDQYLGLAHVAAAPASGARPGLVDRMLAEHGHARRVVAWVPYLNALPLILAQSDLVLTTGAHLARQFADQAGLQVFTPPIKLPRMRYTMMWHERAQHSSEHRWLRDLISGAVSARVR